MKIKYAPSFFFYFSPIIESDKRPLKKVVARAGTNLTLPCTDAVGEKSAPKIEKLTWKSSQTIIKYINGRPLEQNQRVSVDFTMNGNFYGVFIKRTSIFILSVQPFSEIIESKKFQFAFQSG